MLYIILWLLSAAVGGYFSFRYISLVCAIRTIRKDIDDIQQDLTQNQMVHLPLPDRHLKELLCSVNAALEAMQKERLYYERREREFQNQIENVSHDLRTPLTVILGYIKLCKKSDAVLSLHDKELMDTITVIEQKAEVMKHLVSQFYDYSRLNADDYELELVNVDVSRVLRESLMGNYQILEQLHLNVEVHIPDRPVWVVGETAALERIFLNLFQNAGRYADSLFQITVEDQAETTSILFVNDTCVFAKSDIPYLFDRFYIQDRSRSKGGTGLGLTVAKSLAEEMEGTLKVRVREDLMQEKDDGERIMICFELQLKSTGDADAEDYLK